MTKKTKRKNFNRHILVAGENGEASQVSLSPFQSVMMPPAPSMTGTNARKSYGWNKQFSHQDKWGYSL